MRCPYCKTDIPEHVMKMMELLDDLEKYPYLLEVPELQPEWYRLRKLLGV